MLVYLLTYFILLLKDKIICVDYSRKIVKYKDENGNIITDIKISKLLPLLCLSIYNKVKECINNILNEHKNKIINDDICLLKAHIHEIITKPVCNNIFKQKIVETLCAKIKM